VIRGPLDMLILTGFDLVASASTVGLIEGSRNADTLRQENDSLQAYPGIVRCFYWVTSPYVHAFWDLRMSTE
jgi:hypothetical protein